MPNRRIWMDKLMIGFMADVLYIKGILCFEEYEAIMDVKNPACLDEVVEKMLTDQYNPYKRGEAYVGYGK